MHGAAPYLSLVVTARNDDHGGNLLGRMQVFVNGWIAQSRRHNLPSELIVVEWNPPVDRPRLMEALSWPDDLGQCSVRFIEVPGELHRCFANAHALPLYQMIAKNAGIRRARGRFILATNIDILFSDELMRFLARQELHTGRMYRIDRHDVMSDVPVDGSIDEQLEYCRTHLLRLNCREGTFALTPEGKLAPETKDIAAPDSGLNFGRGWFPVERCSGQEIFRCVENDAEIEWTFPQNSRPVLCIDLEPGPSMGGRPMLLHVIEADQSIGAKRLYGRSELQIYFPQGGPSTRKLRLRVFGGGDAVAGDPRILNFRVFSCWWEHVEWEASRVRVRVASATAPRSVLKSVRTLWRQMQALIALVTTQSPRVTFIVPPRVKQAAAFYIEWGGLTGIFSNGLSFLFRKLGFRKRALPGTDIFHTGSGVRPGLGWGRLECYRRETFRRVDHQAQVSLSPSADQSCVLLLQLEPECRSNHRRSDLVVCDESGEIVARRQVRRLKFLRIPLHGKSGRPACFTLRLEVGNHVDGAQPETAGFRVFWCGLEGTNAGHSSGGVADIDNLEDHQSDVSGVMTPPSAEPSHDKRRRSFAFLHTNACGDFTLAAREFWFDLRAYPEFELFSMNLDSVFCYSAHYGGALEEVLPEPMRIYHIEHARGSGWTPEGQAKLFERIAAQGLSFIDNQEVLAWAAQMDRLKSPMIFNRETWGLAAYDLPETTIQAQPGKRHET